MDELILGIETSCDETAAAVVAGGRRILSNVIASQADDHRRFGGVVPENASRMHVEAIIPVIDDALRQAGASLGDIEAVAVTYGPGLVGALLVGLSAAKGIALATGKPLVGVHHIEGHIAANYLTDPDLEPPFTCLVASGGHSHIVRAESHTRYRVLARTRDDAAGEAFDKIARALGLGYPGGPLLDKAAEGGRTDAVKLPRTDFPDSLDFSFSGLKTAALNQLTRLRQAADREEGKTWQDIVPLRDFAASFQQALVDVLVDHTFRALSTGGESAGLVKKAMAGGESAGLDTLAMAVGEPAGLDTLAMAGGVAANSCLRRCMAERARREGVRLICPPPSLCTDNAAMIAAAGFFAWRAGRRDKLSLNAVPYLELGGDSLPAEPGRPDDPEGREEVAT